MQYWFTFKPKAVVGLMPEYPGVWSLKPTVLQCFQALQEQFGDYVLFKALAGLSLNPIVPRTEPHDYYLDLRYSQQYDCYIAQDLVYSHYQVRATSAEAAITKFFQGCTLLQFPQG